MRRDLREDCVFTIDGIGARDLDDGTYDIGVPIADVSHFVKFNALLDRDACKRATSAYLTQRAAPMLPPNTRTEVCGLNPGKDRLTFSVVFTTTEDAHVSKKWFGHTGIK